MELWPGVGSSTGFFHNSGASGFNCLGGFSDLATNSTIGLKGVDCSGRFSELIMLGVTVTSFTSISASLGACTGSVEIFACGSSIGKWLAAVSLSSACA